MPTLLSIDSQIAKYLLGDLAPDESRQIEDSLLFDHNLRRELETAEEELIAAYVVGMLREEDQVKFETNFLPSEERARKLKFAKAWLEKSVSTCPDLTPPLYRYILGDMAPGAADEVEQKLLFDAHYRGQLETAEDELLMAYFENTLPEHERGLFEVNYFINDQMVRKLRFAHIMCEYVKRASVASSPDAENAAANRRRRALHWLFKPFGLSLGARHIALPVWQPLMAALIAIIGFIIWMSLHQSAIDRGLLALSAAYAEGRPVEARLTGFDYTPYQAGQNGNGAVCDRHKRDEAFSLIIGYVAESRSAAAYHAFGKFYLTDKDFDEAIRCFEIALQNNVGDAKLRNDFAVALMERAKARNPGQSTGEDFTGALEHLHRAIELDGSLLEAHFNLALYHQYRTLWRTAEEDWKRYLEKDSQSPWAEEARNNLTKVTEKIQKVGESRTHLRRMRRRAPV